MVAGRAVSEYLRTNLHRNVEKVLKEAGGHGVEECLRAAYLLTGACSAPLQRPLPVHGRSTHVAVELAFFDFPNITLCRPLRRPLPPSIQRLVALQHLINMLIPRNMRA